MSEEPESFEFTPTAARLSRMRKNILNWCNAATDWTATDKRDFVPWMVTTTYRPSEDWSPRDITGLLKNLRMWSSRRGLPMPYCWVLELHKSGRPHYHVLLWLPLGWQPPKPDQAGWWTKGTTRRERVEKSAHGYMAKYLSKFSADINGGHDFPPGARICGRGGIPRESDQARVCRWWAMPAWARDVCSLARRPDGRLCTLLRFVRVPLEGAGPRRPLFDRYGHPRMRGRRVMWTQTHTAIRVDCNGAVHDSPYVAVFCKRRRVITVRRKEHAAN